MRNMNSKHQMNYGSHYKARLVFTKRTGIDVSLVISITTFLFTFYIVYVALKSRTNSFLRKMRLFLGVARFSVFIPGFKKFDHRRHRFVELRAPENLDFSW